MFIRHRSWPFVEVKRLFASVAVLALFAAPASAQTFTVDFSRWSGEPLVKTKMAVYQTPFLGIEGRPDLISMRPFLTEAGVQDLRYEMGWGKTGTFAFDQIMGTAAKPEIDFRRLDPLVTMLRDAGITPLFAMTYDPLPLKTGTDWQRWKDAPSDLNAWGEINRRYAAHYASLSGLPAPFYEQWNEPDLPGDGGKVFFNGKPEAYALVCAAGVRGAHQGAAEARAGGAAIAYDLSYIAPIVSTPIDFASIHAYDNYAGQLNGLRGQLKDRPDLPMLLTEYASFTSFGADTPVSRHAGAERFFRDVKGLLGYHDLAKVYWAQWIDNDLGMITYDLHRKAIFNAYKIYQTMLPVDRNPVTPDGDGGVNVLASSDDHNACTVLWNENSSDKTVTVNLQSLPFAHGALKVYRIDAQHASYVDNAKSENLTVDSQSPTSGPAATWTGVVPAESVVLLSAEDETGLSLLKKSTQGTIGTFVRSNYWFPDRVSGAYADFDPHTSIARLGSGNGDHGAAMIGNVIDHPTPFWTVVVKREGAFTRTDKEALFGLRIDYGSTRGGYSKSVLWHDGSYRPDCASKLPWGTGSARVDKAVEQKELRTGGPFEISVAREAPKDWSHKIIITPILQNMSTNSRARIILTKLQTR